MAGIVILTALFFYIRLSYGDEKDASKTINLEIAAFQGGYGVDFFEECIAEYKKLHPNIRIEFRGNPRMWEQLLPRFAAGTPPDISWPGWGMNIWSLIFDNHVLPLNKYLDEPAYGSNLSWKEAFIPTLLNKGKFKDTYYIIPFNFDSFGLWYNENLFTAHGWKIPQTYEEFLALCETIKEQRIAPITFAGRYPSYAMRGFFYPWLVSAGGYDVLKRIGNLEEGAWKHPACLRAIQCIMELKRRFYFQSGCIGMNHTESQMEFLVGRVAMIPCGTWLHSEMRNLLPPDFKMAFMLTPVFPEGVGDPGAVLAGIDGQWLVSSQTQHPDESVDFLKFLASPEKAKEFVLKKGSLMSLKIPADFDPPEYLREAFRAANKAQTIYNPDFESWYPALATEINNAFNNVYNEIITPEEFLERLERVSQKIRQDQNIHKFTME